MMGSMYVHNNDQISLGKNALIADQVKGEVYLVDEAMLSQLDILEDHPTYYRSILNLMIHCIMFNTL